MSRTTDVVVGRIGKPHGLRGEVTVELRTDEPDARFAPGTVLDVEAPDQLPAGAARPTTLLVESIRWHQERLLVSFAEVDDRNAAEALRGLFLRTTIDLDETPEDPEEFYDHQLVGLGVVDTAAQPLGEIRGVVHGAAQDLLSIRTTDGRDVLVPFVAALVPTVDLEAGLIVVEDRPGLVAPDPEQD